MVKFISEKISKKKENSEESNTEFKIPTSPFIDFLEELKTREDRGALAALRRGLQFDTGKCVDMYPYIIPWIKKIKSKWEKDMHYLIASLFAYHPSSTYQGDLGEVFRKISEMGGEKNSIEQRFKMLLRTNPEDLPYHLRQAIFLAKSHNIPVHWHELFFDLKRWPYESDYPPYEKWANSFWKFTSKENNEN